MTLSSDEQDKIIAIWAKTVETQMHFNEMSVKSRQLGLTFVAAALGVAVVLLSRGNDFAFPVIDLVYFEFQLHVSVVLVLGALGALVAVKGLDLNVYHKMLRGAVTFGEDLEENYLKKIVDLNMGMTQAISHFSRFKDANKETMEPGKYKYTGSIRVSAETKIRQFYNNTAYFLLGSAFALVLVTNINLWTQASSKQDPTHISTPTSTGSINTPAPDGDKNDK